MTVEVAPRLFLRRVVGWLRIAAAALVLASLITQVVDELLHHILVPSEYFAVFTHQVSIITVVVFVIGGVTALRTTADGRLLTSARVSIFSYGIVMALVYNALLRDVHVPGYQVIDWPAEVLHVVIPVFVVLDWIIAPGAVRVGWRALWFVMIYPTAWIIATMIRGVITGWYPYPFLEPSQPGGWFAVAGFILGIAAIIAGFAAVGIAISRVRSRQARPA